MCTAFLEYESTNGLLTFCKKKKKKKKDVKLALLSDVDVL